MTTVNMSSSDNTSVRHYLPCYEHSQASFASAGTSAQGKAGQAGNSARRAHLRQAVRHPCVMDDDPRCANQAFNIAADTSKSRRFGFHQYVDTFAMFEQA